MSICYRGLLYSQTAPPRGASGEGGYPVTAWRTSCLYGFSYSRASPRLFVGELLPELLFVNYHNRALMPLLTADVFPITNNI